MSDVRYVNFAPGTETAEALVAWWKGLERDRGERAALRRCTNLTEVAFVPSYHQLLRVLSPHGKVDAERLALVAGLAARVKGHNPGVEIAVQMAQTKPGGSSAVVSGLRFRRLLKIQNREELFLALGRVVALLGGTVNLVSLAKSAYEWNEWTRKQWAFNYYSAAPSEA
jgi:CRISPR system Cascade subunit CasB